MARILLLFITLIIVFSSCYSLKDSIESGKPYNEQINWSNNYKLSETEFYIHNRIEIEASPEKVWNILINAEEWPNWYDGMKSTKVIDSKNGILTSKSKLKFNTMNRDFDGEVIEFEPYERLSWETINPKLNALHAWLIIPTDKGCIVVTDESQKGRLAKLQTIFVPNKLKNLHQFWLTELKKKAESKN